MAERLDPVALDADISDDYPDRVKDLLLGHCTDLDRDPYIQGKGMPNLVKMLMNT